MFAFSLTVWSVVCAAKGGQVGLGYANHHGDIKSGPRCKFGRWAGLVWISLLLQEIHDFEWLERAICLMTALFS